MGQAALTEQHSFQETVEAETRQSGVMAGIDAHPVTAFVFLSAIYFVVVFTLSSMKLLWLDELITLHLAKLNGFAELWHALARGADPNPPITYVLVHWSWLLFGDHEFAYRIPSAIGYWVGLVSLFAYLKPRLKGTWVIFGCLVSMAMGAFDYSFESRSYPIFYGLAMLAFLCWTITADSTRTPRVRWVALAGMVLALAGGISTNYFAVLAFLPPAAGELGQTLLRIRRRRPGAAVEFTTRKRPTNLRILRAINLRVWAGFAIALAPLLVYRPLIEHSIAQFAPYAWNKVSLDQVFDSYTEMVEVILIPLVALFALGGLVFLLKRRSARLCGDCRETFLPRWIDAISRAHHSRTLIPTHEAVGIFMFLIYPFSGYVIASIRGGMLSPRFVIPVCFGFAIAGAVVAQYLFQNMPRVTAAFLCIALAWFLCRESVVGYWYEEQKQCFYQLVNSLEQADARMPANSPIAIPDPLLALTFWHYAPDYLANREVFPVDFPAIRYYRHDDSPEENLWAGRDFLYRMRVEPLADFQGSVASYLVVAGPANWLLKDLRDHRYRVTQLPIATGADALGGFTPLAHGTPSFYSAQGDAGPNQDAPANQPPAKFKASQNLPDAKWFAPPEPLNVE